MRICLGKCVSVFVCVYEQTSRLLVVFLGIMRPFLMMRSSLAPHVVQSDRT
jgi:hypothetical protein